GWFFCSAIFSTTGFVVTTFATFFSNLGNSIAAIFVSNCLISFASLAAIFEEILKLGILTSTEEEVLVIRPTFSAATDKQPTAKKPVMTLFKHFNICIYFIAYVIYFLIELTLPVRF